MQLKARARSPGQISCDGPGILRLALILTFPVIGLGQFLRTPPAQLSAEPVLQAEHWVTGSLMALPLFAAGIWAADRIANRARLGVARPSDIFKRSLVIVLLLSLALIPMWFERNKADGLAQAQALVTPHSHGSVDVYWVGPGVILALVCVCLVPAAVWAGRSIASRLAIRRPRGAEACARVAVLAALVAGAPVLAWLLHQAAVHAYASQVNNTSRLLSAHVHSHAYFGGGHRSHISAGPPVTSAPFALAYQVAHALQDGLAGQAIGYPMAVIAVWGVHRRAGATSASRQNPKGDTENEPAPSIEPKGSAEDWRIGRRGSSDQI